MSESQCQIMIPKKVIVHYFFYAYLNDLFINFLLYTELCSKLGYFNFKTMHFKSPPSGNCARRIYRATSVNFEVAGWVWTVMVFPETAIWWGINQGLYHGKWELELCFLHKIELSALRNIKSENKQFPFAYCCLLLNLYQPFIVLFLQADFMGEICPTSCIAAISVHHTRASLLACYRKGLLLGQKVDLSRLSRVNSCKMSHNLKWGSFCSQPGPSHVGSKMKQSTFCTAHYSQVQCVCAHVVDR